MKYIKTYESFELNSINEGKATDFVKSLLSKGVLPALIVLQLSKMIGSERAIGTVADVIENYDGVSLYNKEVTIAKNIAKEKCKKFPNKDFLIKKIDEIPVRMGEIKSKIGTTGAQFQSNGIESVILLNSKESLRLVNDNKEIASKNITNALSHEYMHYIDNLLAKEKLSDWSQENKDVLLDIIDKDVNKEKIMDRLAFWMWGTTIDKIKSMLDKKDIKDIYNEIDETADFIIKNKSYLTSPEEIFVRIQGLRNYMSEIGILKNINSEISEDNLNELIDYHKNNDKTSLIQFEKRDVLYLLSLIKIKGLSTKINKIASSNTNFISDLT